ncbi:MAG: phytanoyl-CoA dioxygenase family protein, partial [Pseudomonadota bacterium]
AEAILGKSCLLSAMLAIRLLPGESVQPWHNDDGHITLPYPRPPFGVSAFWALDATTEQNGATELIPGSHRWTQDELESSGILSSDILADQENLDPLHDPAAHPDTIKALLNPGSLMLTQGSLWHRGGANVSQQSRTIITPQYCIGWARQLENQLIAIPQHKIASLPPRAQELVGYSIHPPFMGYVNGLHPNKQLNC